jgi:hypothetical protein
MIEEILIWRIESKTLFWSIIKPSNCPDNFFIRNGSKIAFLGKVLTDKPIRVFVRSPLPG